MKEYKHLTLADRIRIEALRGAGLKPCDIAKQLGVHHATIYRELKRGEYQTRDYEYREIIKYSPELAHQKYRENLKYKGKMLKIGNDRKYADYIENKIAGGYSPAAVLGELKAKGMEQDFNTKICTRTLYRYIDMGLFLHITNNDMPIKKNRKARKKKILRVQKTPQAGDSIEKRPKAIEKRNIFGHWEMDTVVGKAKGKQKPALLVLTERKTRHEIIRKLQTHTAAEVVRQIDLLEHQYGKRFKDVFKTITVDNGKEFAYCREIEQSKLYSGKRTKLYYCHPYSSYERGSNENANRLIRRHIPKSTDIYHSEEEIQIIEDWINNYPRGIHGYKTARNLFDEEYKKVG